MANIITACRILCGIGLLFYPAFSAPFNALYLLGGLTDALDGPVARRAHTESRFGARLDTAADCVFAAAALLKILPTLSMPCWLWLWITTIAAVKAGNAAAGLLRYGRLMAEHTLLNKLTGLVLFLLPLTLHFIPLEYSAAVVCAAATGAALQEGYLIQNGREVV